jgi:DNA-binding MarR family transcriptional regulator
MDTMREFGAMVFASRLRRLSDKLKAEATKLYRANGIEFNDSWFLVAFVLSKREGISVTEIADALGISHAAISQMAAAMERKRLLVTRPDKRDRRRTILRLTQKGRAAVEAMEPIWKAVGDCTDELLVSTGGDPLRVISEIEERLQKKSLFDRVTEHTKKVRFSRGG